MSDSAERLKAQAEAFARMWTDFASRMAGSGQPFPGDAPSPEAARQMRDAMFEVMARYADQFMRSPEFLEHMKQSIDGAVEFRKQFNAFLTELHHGAQGASLQDVDGLLRAMEALQRQVTERIDRISDRLDVVEAHLKPAKKATKKRKKTTPRTTASSRTRRRR